MKKLITMGLLSLPVALVAAIALTTQNLNSALVDALKAFQSNDSKIGMEFSELKTSKTSVEKLKLKAWLWRKGSHNIFDLKLETLDYDYDNGANPTLTFDGNLKLDLIKAFGIDNLNYTAESLEEEAQYFSEEYLEKYGNAAKVFSEITESSKDADGNYQSLTAKFKVNIDYKSLPVDVKIDEVELQSAEVTISLTTNSVDIQGNVVFNPQFLGFGDQASGLKVELEKLVNREVQAIDDMQRFLSVILYYVDETISQDFSE